MTHPIPEVLAPAGDRACLEAAVSAGADAVYFGLQSFSARARATNFALNELEETLAYLHRHGRRGYVTLNTLIFDPEFRILEKSVRACAEAGVDAVIVQDLGAVRLVRAVAPSLRIHASTQMTCADGASAEFAKSMGATRVVLPRELSLQDIGKVALGTSVELEIFVHGALCISYSGQCLTSEAIGGRSANRGACAQACRLPYDLVVDGKLEPLGNKAYLLSPQDLEASHLVPQLAQLGIASLKIEGRLKQPTYVAAATQLYRQAVDAWNNHSAPPTAEVRRTALQAFTRGSGAGFLEGVDHQSLVDGRSCDHRGEFLGQLSRIRRTGEKEWLVVQLESSLSRGDGILVEGGRAGQGEFGGRIWALAASGREVDQVEAGQEAMIWLGPERLVRKQIAGNRVFRTSDPQRERILREQIDRGPSPQALSIFLKAEWGSLPVLHGRTEDGREAQVTLDAALEAAGDHPLTEAIARDKLGRLGGTQFHLTQLTMDLPQETRIGISALNRGRRQLVDALAKAAERSHPTTSRSAEQLLSEAHAVPQARALGPGLFVLCRHAEQAAAALRAGADGLILDLLELTGTGTLFRDLRAQTQLPLILATPRIRKPGEQKIDDFLKRLRPDGLLVRNLGSLQDLCELHAASRPGPQEEATSERLPYILDFSLNITNTLSAVEHLNRGAEGFTPAYELDSQQLLALLSGPLGARAEVVIHHPMPLFYMEHCLFAARLSPGKDHHTCGRPCERHRLSLRDRAQLDHPVMADVSCRNTIFHNAAQTACEHIPALRELGVQRFRLELVQEESCEVERLVTLYKELIAGRLAPGAAFSALGKATPRGVVRGSLRIIS